MTASPVIVIGAGLSGLAAAVRLSNESRPVVVVDAGSAPGGCCSTESVDGFRFNNGAVYGATPNLLRHAFSCLDMDLDSQICLRPIEVPQLSILDSGTQVYTTSVEGSRVLGENADTRTARYRRELEQFCKAWRPIYRRLTDDVLHDDFSLFSTLAKLWRYLPRLGGTVAGLLEKSFSDPEVRAAVGAVTLYTGLAPDKTPASQIIGLLALLEEGFFLPVGGMGVIADALEERARNNGVEIRLNARVQHIEYRNGQLVGVRMHTGEMLPASTVIASNSAVDVMTNLLAPETVPARLLRRAKKSPLSHRAVSIQLGVKWRRPPPTAFAINYIPLLEEQHRFHQPAAESANWFACTNPTSVLPELAPDGTSIIEMFAPVPKVDRASLINDGMVSDIADSYVDGLKKRGDFEILTRRIMAPSDFMHQRHLYEGALYGLVPGAKPTDYFPRAAGLPGLYLAGQTTYPGYGVPTVILSGLHAANTVLRKSGAEPS